MLWVSSVTAAALGQVRIKARNWAIAAAARGVCMAIKAPIMKKPFVSLSPSRAFTQEGISKDYAIATAAGTMRSLEERLARAAERVARERSLCSLSAREAISV